MKRNFEESADAFLMSRLKETIDGRKQIQKSVNESKETVKSGKKKPEDIFQAIHEDILKDSDGITRAFYGEGFGDEEENKEALPDEGDTPIEDTPEMPEDEKDSMDKADDVLEDLDLSELDNATRLELIRTIIDSAQNQSSEDDEMTFDDFMAGAQEVFDSFQTTEEEPAEEVPAEGEEMPAETPPEELPAEPAPEEDNTVL